MFGRGGCCCRIVSPTIGYPMMGYGGRGAGVGIIAIAILILIALGVIF
jgi:hypothetical protein